MERTPTEMAQEINEQIKAIQETATSKEEATKLINEAIEKHNEKVEKVIKDMDERLLALQEKADKGDAKAQKTLKQIVDDNIEGIRKAFEDGKIHSFTVKADATTASVANNTAAQRENDISPLESKKLTVYDLFRKVRVGRNNNGTVTYYDWDAATTARAAAMVAEGGTFPESTAAWEEKSVKLKKIGDTMPITEEFKYDTAMFSDEIAGFLNTNVMLEQDDQIINGDGTGNNLLGIVSSCTTYVPAAAGISDASRYDLIVKVAEAITKGKGNKFRPNVVLMNLTEINAMRLKKDANENYIMPPFVDRNGNVVAGITVIEENGLADNTCVVGDTRYGKIYEDEDGYTFTTGYVNDDFAKDLETLKARKRVAFLIREYDRRGWYHVADIATALATLAS